MTRMATVHDDYRSNLRILYTSPTKEGWGRKPLLRPDQPGDIVVLEGVARKGDYVTWTRTYLYDERDIHRKDIIAS